MSSNRHGSATVTLKSDLEIVITRKFDASARLVFKAYTTPDLIKRWWGGCGESEWLVCENDLRVGGMWRYVTKETRGAKSFEVAFHGIYSAIEAPHLLVTTEVFEAFPDGGAIDTVTFEEADGVTTMTVTVLHEKKAHRDAHINSGMEGGMQLSYDRMEDLLAASEATV